MKWFENTKLNGWFWYYALSYPYGTMLYCKVCTEFFPGPQRSVVYCTLLSSLYGKAPVFFIFSKPNKSTMCCSMYLLLKFIYFYHQFVYPSEVIYLKSSTLNIEWIEFWSIQMIQFFYLILVLHSIHSINH